MLEDYTTAPISDAERALFAFIAKVVEDSTSITPDDLERARKAGWTDEALYAKYGITDEEIEFIESVVRPLTPGGETGHA